MNEPVRVIQYGVGAMGGGMVRLLQSKPLAQVVGAIDHDPAKIGCDLGQVAGLEKPLGIAVGFPPAEVLDRVDADVVLLATTAFIAEAYPQIMALLDHKLNVVTIAQELFFPLGDHRRQALELDARAREAGVRICAVGINPGFAMDLIPIVGSLPCWQIDHVFVRRVVDFSPYGPDEMRHIGVGLSPAGFHAGARSGTIGHIGLLETAGMVGYCLGIPLDELRQTKEPLVSDRARKTPFAEIGPGQVYGFRQSVSGLVEGKAVLEFQMQAFVAPDAREQEELGDYTRIDGTPSVDIRIKEQIAQRGGLGTSATAVNAIPRLLQAPPGLHPFYDLLLPHFWSGRAAAPPVERIHYA